MSHQHAHTPRGRFARGVAIDPEALRRARFHAGLTLEQAARGICSRQAMSQFEGGKARPMPGTLKAIAERLGTTIDALCASPHDPRETTMRELEERGHWAALERLASKILGELNITPRMKAIARFYLGRSLVDREPAEARVVLGAARGHLARAMEPWMAAEARDWEAVALYYEEDPSALGVARDALARYRALADGVPIVEARMLEHIGTCLLQRQDVEEALAHYRKALEVGGQVVNLARLASVYHGIASGCLRAGETHAALEHFERAVNLSRVHHDVLGASSVNLARLENDYGGLLLREGKLDRAEELFHSALNHFAQAGAEAGRAHVLLSMGELKYEQGLLQEAEYWTGQALDQAELQGENLSLAAGYQQLGELRAAQGLRDAMEGCFLRAFQLLEQMGLPERLVEARARYELVSAGPARPA